MGTVRSVAPEQTLRPAALEIGIKFPCTHCEAKLVADFDLLGRLIDCPACHRMIQVPRWSVPDVDLEVSLIPPSPPETLLSPEELAFLSEEGIAR